MVLNVYRSGGVLCYVRFMGLIDVSIDAIVTFEKTKWCLVPKFLF